MEKGLLEKTGQSLDHWIKVVKDSGLQKHGEILKFLKVNHNFTHGYANFVSLKARASDAASQAPEDLVAGQYEKKSHMLPWYEKIIQIIQKFGSDVEIVPKKSSVSLRRNRQFALIQPSTKTRMDLGLKFNDRPIDGRLESSGPFGAMCTHRVQIKQLEDIDDQLVDWLKAAYDEAG